MVVSVTHEMLCSEAIQQDFWDMTVSKGVFLMSVRRASLVVLLCNMRRASLVAKVSNQWLAAQYQKEHFRQQQVHLRIQWRR